MIKVWGRLSSINVQKVVWCLGELGLAFERTDAGGAFGVVNTPEYLRLNPNGLVPTIEHDGFVLWESNAIVRYLVSGRAEAGLWPADPHVRADADRWMDWQATSATPAMRDVFWQLVRTKPENRDMDAVARSVAASERNARILDAQLADRPYVAGDRFTIGDIATGGHVTRWLKLPIERPALPNLQAWHARLASRPAARPIVELELS